MSTDGPAPASPPVTPGALLLELVLVPVDDVDRAKTFYAQAGFHLDVDVTPSEGVRFVQFTPPGSSCSIALTTGLPEPAAAPGTLRGVHLVVADMAAARDELLRRGVEVGPVEEAGGGMTYARFADPDGNTWTLQHMPWRMDQPETT